MFLLLGAFIAGVLTVLAPCVLPLLPIIIGGSVSGDTKDRRRDYEEKLADYAATGIAEYWIADPERQVVVVHRLDG